MFMCVFIYIYVYICSKGVKEKVRMLEKEKGVT